MSVQAKMVCYAIDKHDNSEASTVRFGAVCRGVENAAWAAATPSATLTMTILNDVATTQFTEGQEYTLTFKPAPKPQPGDGHQIERVTTKTGHAVCGPCGLLLTKSEVVDGTWQVVPNDEGVQAHQELYGDPVE